MRVYISSFTANPNYGSEFAVGWNIPYELSKLPGYEVYLFIGTYEGGGFGRFDGLQDLDKPSSLHIIPVPPNSMIKFLNFFNSHLKLHFTFYWALRLWHYKVYQVATKLKKDNPPAITHQLSPIGFREPGYLFKLGANHIWGPIGGCQKINTRSFKKRNLYYLQCRLKNFINLHQIKSTRIKKAVERTHMALYATLDNKENFEEVYGKTGAVCSETGAHQIEASNFRANKDNVLNCIVVGSLIPRKNVGFLLDVFKNLNDSQFHLRIIGDGILKKKLLSYTRGQNLTNVEFLGFVDHNKIDEVISSSDLCLMPSHSEGNSHVIFECFKNLVPVVAFDRNGFSTTLSNNRGFLIKDESNYEENIRNWKNLLEKIANNHQLLEDRKSTIKENLSQLTWEAKAKFFDKIYHQLLEQEETK